MPLYVSLKTGTFDSVKRLNSKQHISGNYLACLNLLVLSEQEEESALVVFSLLFVEWPLLISTSSALLIWLR